MVLNVLREHQKTMSAYDIAAAVSERRGRRVYASGVYRVLLGLDADETVVFVASFKGYAIAPTKGEQAFVLLVCSGCRAVSSLTGRHVDLLVADVQTLPTFRFSPQHIEIPGLCSGCAEAAGGRI